MDKTRWIELVDGLDFDECQKLKELVDERANRCRPRRKLSDDELSKIRRAGKMAAIKRCRELLGCRLREACDIVMDHWSQIWA